MGSAGGTLPPAHKTLRCQADEEEFFSRRSEPAESGPGAISNGVNPEDQRGKFITADLAPS